MESPFMRYAREEAWFAMIPLRCQRECQVEISYLPMRAAHVVVHNQERPFDITDTELAFQPSSEIRYRVFEWLMSLHTDKTASEPQPDPEIALEPALVRRQFRNAVEPDGAIG